MHRHVRRWTWGLGLLLVTLLGRSALAGVGATEAQIACILTPSCGGVTEALQARAEQGDAAAQFHLGLRYDHGAGVPRNDGQAAKWYRRAADQGQAAAQAYLGAMYLKGVGVPQDAALAYFWGTLAVSTSELTERGREGAAMRRDRAAAHLTPVQRAEVQARVRTWQPKPETAPRQAPGATDRTPAGPR